MDVLNLSPDLRLSVSEMVGQCVAILGIRGSGKSNTAGVIFEELLAAHYPLTIVDIDGEYFGLKEKYEVLVVGAGDNVDVEVGPDSAAWVAEISINAGVPVVLDVSDMLAEERELFVLQYLTRIWSLAGKLRKPYMIGIEECHEFIPQGVRTPVKEVVARIALRGRKRGLGAVIISQRSAKVEKDVLTQAGMLFLHRVVHEADMHVYGELLPWRKAEVKELVGGLSVGECIFVSGQSVRKVRIRLRETFHGGFTPSFQPVETPKLRQVSQEIVAAVNRMRTEPHEEIAHMPTGENRTNPRCIRSVEETGISNGEFPSPVLFRVERLIRRVSRLPLHERRILGLLVACEPRAYTTAELAAWIDCAEGILLAEPPTDLVEMGLVVRERFARGITYRASLRSYVLSAFNGFLGDLGPDGIHRLVAHLRRELIALFTTDRNFHYIA